MLPVGDNSVLPVASLLILAPLIFAALTFLTKTKGQAAGLGFTGSLLTLALTVYTYLNFDRSTAAMQFLESVKWVPSLGINYSVGIDGISMPLILLNAIVIPFLILYSWREDRESPNRFYGLILTMEAAVLGVFLSLDFVVFYIFWELTLIPLFFMVNIWGGEKRVHASYKFFIYTHLASLIMLLGIFGLYFTSLQQTGVPTFDIRELVSQFRFFESDMLRNAIFLSILFGFLAKLPVFPFHSWLPDAYTEAPTAGSVLFILLKIGGYGLFRISLPMLPSTGNPQLMITMLGLLGSFSIVYGALVALRQKDLKRMIAYSSVSHMGYVILGAAGLAALSVSGAMFQQFSHGLILSLMFMSAGAIEASTGTRIINDLGGLTKTMPKLAVIMMLSFMASLALPGLTGFIAEFLVLAFSYARLPGFVIFSLLAVVITAGYHLWAIQRTMFGVYNEKLGNVRDINSMQAFSMAVISLLVIYYGLNPSPVLNMMIKNSEAIVSLSAALGV